jgi:hypothetical protein
MPLAGTLSIFAAAAIGPMGLKTPTAISSSSPPSSAGVSTLPTMSTTADSFMQRASISAKKAIENTAGLTPLTRGSTLIS